MKVDLLLMMCWLVVDSSDPDDPEVSFSNRSVRKPALPCLFGVTLPKSLAGRTHNTVLRHFGEFSRDSKWLPAFHASTEFSDLPRFSLADRLVSVKASLRSCTLMDDDLSSHFLGIFTKILIFIFLG